jgi:hypothetical protein
VPWNVIHERVSDSRVVADNQLSDLVSYAAALERQASTLIRALPAAATLRAAEDG